MTLADRQYAAEGHDHAHTHGCEEIVRVSCVQHSYEDGTRIDLCGLDFLVDRGSRVAVLGPNGAGKTTLLFHVLGLLASREGEVRVFGVDPSRHWAEIRRRVGVVLQDVDEQLIAPTVADDVAFSPRQHGLPDAEVRERVERALALVGIAELADRVPHNLSGGEKRKVAFAGALVMDPELLVLDEPFEGLDPASREELIGLLERLARERGTTIVLTTHDIDAVAEFADYAYVLAAGGHIVLKGTPAEVFRNASVIAASNIRPPVLAALFDELRAGDPDAPAAELTVTDTARALRAWKCGRAQAP